MNDSYRDLYRKVVENDYCIGCGVCAVPEGSPFRIEIDRFGQFKANLRKEVSGYVDYEEICPFGEKSIDEDDLGKQLYGADNDWDNNLGYYRSIFAGHVVEGSYRENGSSGGMVTWLISELFKKGLIDHVIHVKSAVQASGQNVLPFSYSVSSSLTAIEDGSKSRYYPVELSGVLKHVKENCGRYVIVGIPCFIKGIRLLQEKESIFVSRIPFLVGLVCGHLKGSFYAQSLAWQVGIPPKDLKEIDFRVKDDLKNTNDYSTFIKGTDKEVIVANSTLFGVDWGVGAFKYKACDFCDDVFAETADVCVGDAWLPEYINDSKGTNLVVVRNLTINKLIVEAVNAKRLKLNTLSVGKAVQSQEAGLRHRKVAIHHRLAVEEMRGEWIPKKRSSGHRRLISSREKKRQAYRTEMRKRSSEFFLQALQKNDFDLYSAGLSSIISKYKWLTIPFRSRLKRCFVKFIRYLGIK